MKCSSFGVLALSSLLLLSACGGRGGESVMVLPPVPPPGPTPAEVRAIINARATTADTLYLTDFVVPASSRLLPGERFVTSCLDDLCGVEIAGEQVWVWADEFVVDVTDVVRVTAPVHGVPTTRVTGTLTDEGVTTDYLNYGGWLDHSAFGYTLGTYRAPAALAGLQGLYAFSFGTPSLSNPLTGSATWTGAMVGTHQRHPTQAIQGRAEAVYSFADQTVDVSMTQLTQGYADLRWQNLDVQQGQFQSWVDDVTTSGTDYLWGTFYGANHEELGGTFERAGIVGAFGAKR